MTDADILREARELAYRVKATSHHRWFVGSDRWAQYKHDLQDLIDLLTEDEDGEGA